jgi:hypothetical protein
MATSVLQPPSWCDVILSSFLIFSLNTRTIIRGRGTDHEQSHARNTFYMYGQSAGARTPDKDLPPSPDELKVSLFSSPAVVFVLMWSATDWCTPGGFYRAWFSELHPSAFYKHIPIMIRSSTIMPRTGDRINFKKMLFHSPPTVLSSISPDR